MDHPNVVFLLADQLRACSLPLHSEHQIATPNLDRLVETGLVCSNAVSTAAICTPYRGMLLTGRYPQSTGLIGNFIGTRHDEIGIGDAFSAAGYQTAWIGKWHLQVGAWPGAGMREGAEGAFHIPPGRQRLGFHHWRGYNFHEHYFGGWVDKDPWRNEIWEGYETRALNRYAMEFMDRAGSDPFCLFMSPHQPHNTLCGKYAPEEYYAKLPRELKLPANIPDDCMAESLAAYRDYLAMILALDDMLGELLDYLERTGRDHNTLVVFTSDHGSQFGSHGLAPWEKGCPYEESVHVPLVMRLPGQLAAGSSSDVLFSPVDWFPTLCELCGIPTPRTVEGRDLSAFLRGKTTDTGPEELLMMNFMDHFCFFEVTATPPGKNIWRAVRTKHHTYVKRYSGQSELYDLENDPLQLYNLSGQPSVAALELNLANRLEKLMADRQDCLQLGRDYLPWFDSQRRVIRNASGPLSHPENPPDFTLLAPAPSHA